MNTDISILTREVFTSAGRDAISELLKSGFSCTLFIRLESGKVCPPFLRCGQLTERRYPNCFSKAINSNTV